MDEVQSSKSAIAIPSCWTKSRRRRSVLDPSSSRSHTSSISAGFLCATRGVKLGVRKARPDHRALPFSSLSFTNFENTESVRSNTAFHEAGSGAHTADSSSAHTPRSTVWFLPRRLLVQPGFRISGRGMRGIGPPLARKSTLGLLGSSVGEANGISVFFLKLF